MKNFVKKIKHFEQKNKKKDDNIFFQHTHIELCFPLSLKFLFKNE